MSKNELPDRAWIAITSMAAAWTPLSASPADYAQALGRAIVVYQGARNLAEHELEVYIDRAHVLSLVPGDDYGLAFIIPE